MINFLFSCIFLFLLLFIFISKKQNKTKKKGCIFHRVYLDDLSQARSYPRSPSSPKRNCYTNTDLIFLYEYMDNYRSGQDLPPRVAKVLIDAFRNDRQQLHLMQKRLKVEEKAGIFLFFLIKKNCASFFFFFFFVELLF